ncbi:hypothetical protein QL285_032971 [Trifolium repens]|nr:hypothetical protein QL285_032971 [Trifolium repens]
MVKPPAMNEMISEIVTNVTGATISTPTSSMVNATMSIPTSTVVSMTTTKPILTLVRNIEHQFSPTRSNVNGGVTSSSTFHLPFAQYMNQGNNKTY